MPPPKKSNATRGWVAKRKEHRQATDTEHHSARCGDAGAAAQGCG